MKRQHIAVASFYAGAAIAVLHESISHDARLNLERIVTYVFCASSVLFLLFCLKKFICRIRRFASRVRLAFIYNRLFRHVSSSGASDDYARLLNGLLLQRLTRHISDYVDDAVHPNIVYYKYYSEFVREKQAWK